MAGKGFLPGNSAAGPREKVKFTVSVRGRQWSSARHVQETLEEFARVIQRNARRLDFIGDNDRIQRLQLAKADGSEPEELDVDATLEDVIICMGNKHLVAIIIPAKSPVPCTRRRETEKLGPSSPMALPGQQKLKLRSGTNQSSKYCLPTPSCGRNFDESELATLELNPLAKRRAATCEPPVRGLKITIPSSDLGTTVLDERVLGNDCCDGAEQELGPNPINSDGGVLISTGIGNHTKSTPSPAELAHFLVKGSSVSPHRQAGVIDNNTPLYSQWFGNGAPIPGFQSFASAILSRLPVIPPSSMVCGQPSSNIAMLAQFLASQLRAFVPANGEPLSPPDSVPFSSFKIESSTIQEGAPNNLIETSSCCNMRDSSCLKNCGLAENGLPNLACSNSTAKPSVSGSHEKDDSSSSANVNIAAASSNDGIKSDKMHGRSELIFFVNRRSKTGIDAHHLKLSDLSVFFHLSVVDAAKKLGVSQTTLKKACRKFGLKRWPGRKVRSLESTIHGLEHTIAVGQGAGMEQLTEAYMRSEVTKLQQEMDHLVHGTLAQHSPVARTADLYKRLYSRGWRSKYHSPCAGYDLDLNIDNRNSDLNLSLLGGKVMNQKVDVVNFGNGCVVQQVDETFCMQKQPSFKVGDQDCTTSMAVSNDINDNIANPLSTQPVGREELINNYIGEVKVDDSKGAVNCTEDLAKDEIKVDDIEVVGKEGQLVEDEERSPKRPKLDVT